MLENYEGTYIEKIGEADSIDNFDMAATALKTFGGQTGVNLTLKMDGKLIHEVCIAADVPVNLFSYTYDIHTDNEYRVELVHYSD